MLSISFIKSLAEVKYSWLYSKYPMPLILETGFFSKIAIISSRIVFSPSPITTTSAKFFSKSKSEASELMPPPMII